MSTPPLFQLDSPRWLAPLLMVGVLLGLAGLCLAVGAAAGADRMRIAGVLIAAPVLLGLAIVVIGRFKSFVLLLPVAALAVPLDVPTGTETKLPAALLLALGLSGIWVLSMLIRREWNITPWALNKPMLAFGIICCISLGWGIAWRDPVLIQMRNFIIVQSASLVTMLISMGAALLIGNFIDNKRQLAFFAGAFLVCGSLMTLTQLLSIRQPFLNDRGLWGLWTVGMAYGMLIGMPLGWRMRLALGLLILLTMYQTMVVNSAWVSGWAPTVVGIATITFLRSKKAFVVLVIVGALAFYGSRAFFSSVAEDNINDGSLERLTLWEQNWRVVSAHWLFGTGPAGYAVYYMTYYRDDARSTHNNYLDILAQFGFTGMAAWLWLAIGGTVEGYRVSMRAPPGMLRAIAITATGGWVGAQASMFFGDWVLPFAYNQGVGGYKYTVYSWLFLGTLLAVRRLMDQEHHQETHKAHALPD
ncbi:MAG: O-antigen ligase family protein [Roseiflexaceae bacterium]